MAWQTPKTDWEIKPLDEQGRYNGDWFNWQDYERIRGNIEFLAELYRKQIPPMISIDDTVVAYPEYTGYVSGATITDELRYAAPVIVDKHINPIEQNLGYLLDFAPRPVDYSGTKRWRANDRTPTVDDINRWERYCLHLYNVQQRTIRAKLPANFPIDARGGLF